MCAIVLPLKYLVGFAKDIQYEYMYVFFTDGYRLQ